MVSMIPKAEKKPKTEKTPPCWSVMEINIKHISIYTCEYRYMKLDIHLYYACTYIQ